MYLSRNYKQARLINCFIITQGCLTVYLVYKLITAIVEMSIKTVYIFQTVVHFNSVVGMSIRIHVSIAELLQIYQCCKTVTLHIEYAGLYVKSNRDFFHFTLLSP